MHAIARRIAARFVAHRDRRRRISEEDDDDDSYERIEISLTNSSSSSTRPPGTPCNIPLGPPGVHGSHYYNQDCSDSCSDASNSQGITKSPGMLYNLAKSWAWAALAHRCETHPWEASSDIFNRDGDTALHWAVFGNPPLYVVKALLKACPDLVNVANVSKQLPLHVACSYRSPTSILKALIDANPETLGYRNKLGFYPLHILCDCGCTVESLKVMLRYPQTIKTITEKDYMYDRTPLYILNQRKNMFTFGDKAMSLRKMRQEQRDAVQAGNWTDDDERKLQTKVQDARENECWQKARLLVLAEYRQQYGFSLDKECVTVRACTELEDCPPSLREYAILAYSEELSVRDEHGKVPLHHICGRGSSKKEDQWALVEMLNAYPEAARVHDNDGMLPLEIFVNAFNNRSEALKPLILAHPIAIDNLRINKNLYPVILAGICQDKDTRSKVYQLIKASPGLFNSFANHQA